MKILLCLVITLVVVQAITDEEKKRDEINDICQKESGVSQEFIDKGRNRDFVDDPKLKVYILCVFKKTGLCKNTGEFDIDAVKTRLTNEKKDDDRINKILKECIVKKEKPEDSAFEFIKCLAKN